MGFLWELLLLSAAIFVVAELLPRIHIKNYWTAIVVAAVFSVINFLFGWVLVIITFPAVILTFGLFKIVINAFLLWITEKIVDDFEIEGFGTTLLAAFLIALADTILRWVFQI